MSSDDVLAPQPTPSRALAAPALLSHDHLQSVRVLAREGVRETSIRLVLGLTPSQWKVLKQDQPDGELSPLGLALEEGRAAGVDDLVAFFKLKMREGEIRAAEWLADRLYKVGREDGNGDQPRVLIQINAALSPEDYRRLVQVQQP
jgi:hypothetical protein